MEYAEIAKLFGAILSALGTVAITTYNLNQSKKIRSEILEKFEEALKRENKHSVCELFRLLHGLRMTYEDIVYLSQNDHVIQIIYALQKTPGMVTFNNGQFQFTELFKNKYFKTVDKLSNKILLWLFAILAILSILLAAFSKGPLVIIAFLFIIVFSAAFIFQKNDYRYNKMVENIVSKN